MKKNLNKKSYRLLHLGDMEKMPETTELSRLCAIAKPSVLTDSVKKSSNQKWAKNWSFVKLTDTKMGHTRG